MSIYSLIELSTSTENTTAQYSETTLLAHSDMLNVPRMLTKD